MIHRKEIKVIYEVLNDSGDVIGIHEITGFNKKNIRWKAERILSRKYNQSIKLHEIKKVL